MPTEPIVLTGHSRDVTHVTFNHDGDLFFSCARDKTCQVWYSKDGERLGSYDHNGAVTRCQPTLDSKYLVTSSTDALAQVFEVETGKRLQNYSHKLPVRDVAWAVGNEMFVSLQQASPSTPSTIFLWQFDAATADPNVPETECLREIKLTGDHARFGAFSRVVFLNDISTILAIHADGYITKWDIGEEELLASARIAEPKKDGPIISDLLSDITLTADRGLALITSRNNNAYLVNTDTLEVVKTYTSDRPLNSGCISPILNHVLLGGGQDKHQVTTTAGAEGRFEVQFFHTFYEEKLTEVQGHYGPVNSVAISRDGRIFCSAAEDGTVRLYHFDEGYLKSSY